MIWGLTWPLLPLGLYLSLQSVIATWPAVYQLFPSPLAPGITPDELAAAYTPSGWTAAGLSASPAWLASAMSTWIGLPDAASTYTWVDFAGLGFTTAIACSSTRPPMSPSDLVYGTEGDGVVPYAWSSQPDRPLVTCPTSHTALPYDGRVMSAVSDYLAGVTPTSYTISGDLLSR